jgi:hypothetical protein
MPIQTRLRPCRRAGIRILLIRPRRCRSQTASGYFRAAEDSSRGTDAVSNFLQGTVSDFIVPIYRAVGLPGHRRKLNVISWIRSHNNNLAGACTPMYVLPPSERSLQPAIKTGHFQSVCLRRGKRAGRWAHPGHITPTGPGCRRQSAGYIRTLGATEMDWRAMFYNNMAMTAERKVVVPDHPRYIIQGTANGHELHVGLRLRMGHDDGRGGFRIFDFYLAGWI